MKYSKTIVLSTAAMLAFAAPSFATNITINDTQGPNAAGWGSSGAKGKGQEDQETEPGTIANQSWDLEAFTLNGGKLKVYSGFDLLNGNSPYALGDIFVGAAHTAKWNASAFTGTDAQINSVNNNSQFKYDYVIHFNSRSGNSIGAGTYDVYQLSHTVSELLDETSVKGLSNPFKLSDRALNSVTMVGSGTMSVSLNPTAILTLEDGTQITGGSHFIGEINLATTGIALSQKDDNIFHLTMGCGNDTLIGRVPDGGATLALLGFAVSGLSLIPRRNGRKG